MSEQSTSGGVSTGENPGTGPNPAPTQPTPDKMAELTALAVNFGLPAIIIIICAIMMACHIDGEVKAVFALAAGWIFKSGLEAGKK